MKVFQYIYALLFLAFFLNQPKVAGRQLAEANSAGISGYYEAGQAALDKGEWKEALNIWLQAKTEADKNNSNTDPRIGFAFIKVVTGKKAEQYYELANTMYFWGIQGVKTDPYGKAYLEELLRLEPIMDDALFSMLKASLEKRDGRFTALLREFWVKQDPFPSSAFNERLIEHWSRIAYAREHYTYAKDTVYGTDDRGLIYVRFGEPHEIKKRNVSINHITDPVTGARIDLFGNVAFDLEIWYYLFSDTGEVTSFTFGRPGNGGSYGLQPGILSMVPVAGNRIPSYYDEQKSVINASQQSSNSSVNIGDQQSSSALPSYTPVSRDGAELMIKYAVLEDIGAIDPFYNQLYNQMTHDIIRAELSGSGEKFTKSAQTNLSKYNGADISAAMLTDQIIPASISETKSEVEELSMAGKFYRFLDKDFHPIYMYVTEAVDFIPVILHLEGDDVSAIYQLNTLYEYDDQWRKKTEQNHILPLNSEGHFGKAVYYFSAPAASDHVLFKSQFLDRKSDSTPKRIHKKYNAEILASTTKQELKFPEELTLDPSLNVQISDIILGISQPEETENRIPFTPNISSLFKINEEIIVYFEIYNLPEGNEYQIEYFFEDADNKQQKIKEKGSIIINYASSSGEIDKKWFNANLTDLKGDTEYNLVIKLLLPNSSQTITRRLPITIVKQ